jgi:hypothetical protein
VNRCEHRVAVVFVEPRPEPRRLIAVHALRDARVSLRMAAQRACIHGIKAQVFGLEILAQLLRLLLAQWAQIVIVSRAKTGLAMAHEVKSRHAQIVAGGCLFALSRR